MRLVRDFLQNTPHVDLVVCGELIFFAVFVAAVFWVFRKGSRGFYEKLAAIPLDQDGGSNG